MKYAVTVHLTVDANDDLQAIQAALQVFDEYFEDAPEPTQETLPNVMSWAVRERPSLATTEG
jgi:hypothetical protein